MMDVLYDKILIRPVNMADLEPPKSQANGFGLHGPGKPEEAIKFVVVSAGPGEYDKDKDRHLPMPVNVGDVICFPHTPNDTWRESAKTNPRVDGVSYTVARVGGDSGYFVIVERAQI